MDGESRPLLKTNYAFMGVEIEPGRHKVEFVFRPTSLYHGTIIFLASLILLLLLWLYGRKTGRFDLMGGHASAPEAEASDAAGIAGDACRDATASEDPGNAGAP